MFRTVSGEFVEQTSYGTNPEFLLRTKKNEVRICCRVAPPVMREGDMICIVLWNEEILSIANLGTGTEIRYRVLAPQGPYWREEVTVFDLLLVAMVVLTMDGAMFIAGAFSQARLYADYPILMAGVIAMIGYGMVLWIICRSAIVNRHNAKITNAIQKHSMEASIQMLCKE